MLVIAGSNALGRFAVLQKPKPTNGNPWAS
jgi:hypothetical protein